MKSFKSFLLELFDSSYDWKWVSGYEGTEIAEFQTRSGTTIRVEISKTKTRAALLFGSVDDRGYTRTMEPTESHEAISVLSTIVEIIRAFFGKYEEVESLTFDGDKGGIGRDRVYYKMVQKLLPSNFDVDVTENRIHTTFTIYKKEG